MCFFVATKNDLEPGIRQLEEQVGVKYVPIKFDESPHYPVYYSALDIPNFGTTESGTALIPEYLIFYREAEVFVREIPQHTGGIVYSIDTRNNPHALSFSWGGWFVGDTSGEFLLGGGVALANKIENVPRETHKMIDLFCKIVCEGFKFLRSPAEKGRWKVGPEAYQALERGIRLVTEQISWPTTYDLQLPVKKK